MSGAKSLAIGFIFYSAAAFGLESATDSAVDSSVNSSVNSSKLIFLLKRSQV